MNWKIPIAFLICLASSAAECPTQDGRPLQPAEPLVETDNLSAGQAYPGERPEERLRERPGGRKRPGHHSVLSPVIVPPPVTLPSPHSESGDAAGHVQEAQQRAETEEEEKPLYTTLFEVQGMIGSPERLFCRLSELRQEFPRNQYFQCLEAYALSKLNDPEAWDAYLTLLESGIASGEAPSFVPNPDSLLPESVQPLFRFCRPTHYEDLLETPLENQDDVALFGHWLRWKSWEVPVGPGDSHQWVFEFSFYALLRAFPTLDGQTQTRLLHTLAAWKISRPDLLPVLFAEMDSIVTYFRMSNSLVKAHPEDGYLGLLWLYAGLTQCDPYIAESSSWDEDLAWDVFHRISERRPQLAALLGILAAMYLPEADSLVNPALEILVQTERPHQDLVQGVLQALKTDYSDFSNHLSKVQRLKLLQHLIRWIPALHRTHPPKWARLREQIVSTCLAYGNSDYRVLELDREIQFLSMQPAN